MGKGHFACLGCNGYFAAGHWGGDGAAAVGGDSALYYYMGRVKVKKDLKPLMLTIKRLLETLRGEEK